MIVIILLAISLIGVIILTGVVIGYILKEIVDENGKKNHKIN